MVMISLKKDYEIKDKKGDVLFHLPHGYTTNTIRYSYLPSHYQDLWDNKEEMERRYYIIYIRGVFLRIPKEDCEVPIGYGGWYNI